MIQGEKKYLWAEPIVAWGSFAILLTLYWLTVAPTVSYWDCPEYVTAAYLLEVGHPPGNPTWMLVERIVTMFAPSPEYAALAVNLSSGLFTAFAAFFLAKTFFRVGLWVLLKLPRRHIPAPLAAAGGALVGTMAFGLCDSIWYSAVEAEVYAMSIFMTSLCLWLMAKWAGTSRRDDSWRLLVLIAYIFGLSIGIHQLNLLCIPALAMIWAVRRGIRTTGKLVVIFLLSLIIVACLLVGMMPSSIALASWFELIAVNRFGLPHLSGVVIYLLTLGASLMIAVTACSRSKSRIVMGMACYPAIFLSGIFIISEHYLIGAIVSAGVAVLLVSGSNFKVRRLYLSIWMLTMLLTGYASYALIPIRGGIPAPPNAMMPGNPFSFAAYQSREVYGSKPLLYGETPYSRPLLHEEKDSTGKYVYKYFEIDYYHNEYVPIEEDGKLKSSIRGLSAKDSLLNRKYIARGKDAYIVKGMKKRQVKTPEQSMWFPRITGSRPFDIRSYSDWIGMDTTTMERVKVSEAIDSAGHYVTKMGADGKRREATGYRPTYLQNAEWFLTYQTAYMYWRYLLWNFSGRQNDRPAQGEVQHGNFITGYDALDNMMLGAEDRLPAVAGKENKGRNEYYLLPLILGIIGIIWLLTHRRRGIQTCAITAILFVMSGLAITVYLNQGPGEPRERDYSFLGSYLAYCVWIGFGAIMLARRTRSVWGFAIPLAVVAWMGIENYGDHDRSGRYAARNNAISLLEAAEPDAIIFVSGDNHTFPLWYAQEVEGIRRDVRVINLSYLTMPRYAANMMQEWRDSKGVPTTLTRGDIIWDAYRRMSMPKHSKDTLDAVEMLRRVRKGVEGDLPCRYVRLKVSPDSTVVFDIVAVTKDGKHIDFNDLMMLDIVATNAASATPRPIYWIEALPTRMRIGMTPYTTKWLYGYRYGLMPEQRVDSLLLAAADKVLPPNPIGREVYMDYAPSQQTAIMRGALVSAGDRLLAHGDLTGAMKMADKADIDMGHCPDSYMPVKMSDSTYIVKRELGRLLLNCADTLERRGGDNGKIADLRERGRRHIESQEALSRGWQEYRRHLPKRLRNKMAPTY